MPNPLNLKRRGHAIATTSLMALLALLQPAAPAAEQPAAELSAANLYQLPFDWQDEHGHMTRLSQWRGHMVMLTMAYSTCREVCTYALHRLEQLQKSAERAGVAVDIVVVSYDPSIDSPATWSIYRRHHRLLQANWHFLTGSEPVTKKFAAALDFSSWLYDEHRVHDFKILLINPAGEIASTLTWANHNEDFFAAAAPSCPHSDTGSCRS
jgi:cytochrome oxidase Cu insertion factor (SCO1/SenC/PrrC family)